MLTPNAAIIHASHPCVDVWVCVTRRTSREAAAGAHRQGPQHHGDRFGHGQQWCGDREEQEVLDHVDGQVARGGVFQGRSEGDEQHEERDRERSCGRRPHQSGVRTSPTVPEAHCVRRGHRDQHQREQQLNHDRSR